MEGRPLEGQVGFVTGGGQGIGRAIALALSRAGAVVFVAARGVDKLDEVVTECGDGAVAVPLDVTDEDACAAAIAAAEREAGRLDILVNNAGVAESSPFLATDTELWRRTMAINVEGPLWLTRAALPGMLERGAGTVIGIASLAARRGFAYVSAYTASKHALLGMTRSLAVEYAASGVTFNCICPHYVDTPMTAATIDNIVAVTGRDRKAARRALLTPQRRLVDPAEVAHVALLLASPLGRGINGQAIDVDGGEYQG
ncbi:MAG TPA: SDR family oxidoreductase [Solirubrobacterales bacterium]|nr:SDR family oxidoreductase [Solirubrobacterales bacterium]